MEPGPKMKGVQREWKYEMCVEDCERLQKCTLIVLSRYINLWTHARRVNLKISISSHAKHNRFSYVRTLLKVQRFLEVLVTDKNISDTLYPDICVIKVT